MGHIVAVKTYVLVFLGLLGLTALTTGIGFINLGAFNTVVALTIAVTKMLLVALFFMHVRYSSHLTKIVVAAGVLWLMLLLGFTLTDYHTRHWTPLPAPWTSGQISR